MNDIKIEFSDTQLSICTNGIDYINKQKCRDAEERLIMSIAFELQKKLAIRMAAKKPKNKIQLKVHQALVLHQIIQYCPVADEYEKNEARMLLAQIDKAI